MAIFRTIYEIYSDEGELLASDVLKENSIVSTTVNKVTGEMVIVIKIPDANKSTAVLV